MKISNKIKEGLSRRNFLKTTAAGMSATALTGFGATSAKVPGHTARWDKEADVVVVGCGAAGITAAITAHDAGSKVIIVEKAPEIGGNSRIGGANFCYTLPAKKNDAANYLFTACNGTTPMEICQAWAEEILHTREWLTKMEVPFMASDTKLGGADFRGFPGSDAIGTGSIVGFGLGYYKAIEKQLKSRNIEILFNSPATELIQNPMTKEIQGVKVKSEGAEKSIKASKGVVLCSGGFEFNEDMKKNYLRPTTIKFVGWKYNTGDGIKMAQSVGADLWHMNMICSAGYTLVTPESEMGWMYPEPKGSNFIFVTKYGQRFMKEGAWFPHRTMMGYSMWDWRDNRKDSEYPCCPHYMIFDETTRVAGAIGINEKSMFTGMGNTITPTRVGGRAPEWGENGGGWSQDNSVEIQKGFIKKAESIAELAQVIGGEMTADALTASIKKWNDSCDAGVDAEFGRSNQERGMFPRKLEKIQKAPFYAVELWPGGFCTLGGPKKNASGQVLNVNGSPIKRLYAAGSLGHTHGQVYNMSGANYGECFAWGRISGRNAAAEKPWA